MQLVWRSFVAAGARGARLADILTDRLEHREQRAGNPDSASARRRSGDGYAMTDLALC